MAARSRILSQLDHSPDRFAIDDGESTLPSGLRQGERLLVNGLPHVSNLLVVLYQPSHSGTAGPTAFNTNKRPIRARRKSTSFYC